MEWVLQLQTRYPSIPAAVTCCGQHKPAAASWTAVLFRCRALRVVFSCGMPVLYHIMLTRIHSCKHATLWQQRLAVCCTLVVHCWLSHGAGD